MFRYFLGSISRLYFFKISRMPVFSLISEISNQRRER
jgi:hypothetical protein